MTFEQFLLEKYSEQYVGTDDCMVDDFSEWLEEVDLEDVIEYGDMFAKEQSNIDDFCPGCGKKIEGRSK